jgi:hypothetical protein
MLHHLDAIPTVSEKDAAPNLSAIFLDIKQTLGVSFVNLIWRHLATIPGGLEMTWSLAKPLYASQVVNESARQLRGQTILVDSFVPWPDPVRDALGLSAQDHREIVLLLEDYGHANSRALLILSYLHASLSAQVLAANEDGLVGSNTIALIDPLARMAPNTGALIKSARPLPATAELSAEVAKLIKILNTFGEPISSPAEPSLYRHLSYWPSFLAAFWVAVEPLERRGILVQESIDTQARAQRMASQWRLLAGSENVMAPDSVSQVLKSLDHFTHAVISRMIVLGDVMKRMMGG